MTNDAIVQTERLELVPWTLELIDALIAGDRAAAEASLEIRFPEPFTPPPETDDVLPLFHTLVAEDQSRGAFCPRMIVRIDDRMALGSIGAMAPDKDGASIYGYGIYPCFEGQGYASEAARGLVAWILKRDRVRVVTATIPIGHTASEIVSTRAGLIKTGRQVEDEGRMLNVWERRR